MPDQGAAPIEPAFRGDIGDTVGGSTPWWPARRSAAGPHVLVVLLDDVGFAQLGCYGSSIRTPQMDALARDGLQYTNFHVTALCSPTRASLLTGRNHHSVGMGFLSAFDTGYPSYRGAVSPAAAMLPELLGAVGYGSYAVGKWHLTPPVELSPAGPFDQWPTQRGFDRYYGFLWGEDDQFQPELWYDQHRVEVPDDPEYHLSQDLVGRAREFISDHVTNRPHDPFLCYLALGACHAPHQAPRQYIDANAGRFDHGWDVERARVLDRQVSLGIVPEGTRLSDRNPGVPAWDDLSADERRLFARYQEAFAGFMEHTDTQIGELVTFLRDRHLLDDTLVILMSDNGASGEGARNGTINEYRYFLSLEDSINDGLAAIDEIGGPRTHNQYPAGWAQAGNTPSKLYKKHAHGGGVRAPLVIHWPAGLGGQTGLRTQFHHAIDILPTVLDVTGTSAPESYRGIPQLPIHGTSMRYTFGQPEAPSTRITQYFETVGHRGVYADGWKAIARHRPGQPFEDDTWELYELTTDFSETVDRAATAPDKARELEALWWREAATYGVLPLDDRMGARVTALDPEADRREYTMLPGSRLLNHVVGPSFSERPFEVRADVTCGAKDEGVLLAYGRRAFGFSVFLKDGRLLADVNLAGRHTVLTSDTPVPEGRSRLGFAVDSSDDGPQARLLVDGRTTARAPLARLIPGGIGTLSVQCGHNSPSPVSEEYDPPFTFTGHLEDVVITLAPRRPDPAASQAPGELAAQ